MADVSIDEGFTEGEREQVAALYWEAFGRKLSPGFADESTGRAVVRAALRSSHLLVAREGGHVVGVCGFRQHGTGAASLGWARLRQFLSVVDANPRARTLYERRGFTPTRRGALGPLAPVYGFDGYTVMALKVGR